MTRSITLAVVIPTRHRPSLAIAAARSFLAEGGPAVRVVISDNSTNAADVAALAAWCDAHDEPRLLRIRPPRPMHMATHWDWALRETLKRTGASHVSIAYDRFVLHPGRLRRFVEAAAAHPASVVSAPFDVIAERPVRLFQAPYDGRLFEIATSRVCRIAAAGEIKPLLRWLPILSNCIVPRDILDRIAARFGDICDSATADLCFTFRLCAIVDAYLHLDLTMGIRSAPGISHSAASQRLGGEVFDDIKALRDESRWLEAAPIAGLDVGFNVIYHEYERVRRAVGGDRFPEIDKDGYLADIASDLVFVDDASKRDALEATLRAHGWDGRGRAIAAGSWETRPRDGVIGSRIAAQLTSNRVVRALARRLRIPPRSLSGSTFPTESIALEQALAHPRRRERKNAMLDALDAVVVSDAS